MSKRDWRRAKIWRSQESKFGTGVILRNGERTPALPKDSLSRRADRAMRAWQRKLSPRDREKLAS
jgi:hypothetical protein